MDCLKEDRWGESLTLSRSPEIELNSPVACLIGVGTLLSMGLLLALLLLAIATGIWKWKVTLVALPTTLYGGGTLLTTGGSNKKVEETLAAMVRDVFGNQLLSPQET